MSSPSSASADQSTVAVRFVEAGTQNALPQVMVPQDCGPQQLNAVVASLLEQSASIRYQFEAVTVHALVTQTLKALLKTHGLSTEAALTLEYAPLVRKPTRMPPHPQPDWVSCVDSAGGMGFVAGCYDGVVNVYPHAGYLPALHNVSVDQLFPDTTTATTKKSGAQKSVVVRGLMRPAPLMVAVGHRAPVKAVCQVWPPVTSDEKEQQKDSLAGVLAQWAADAGSHVRDLEQTSTPTEPSSQASGTSTAQKDDLMSFGEMEMKSSEPSSKSTSNTSESKSTQSTTLPKLPSSTSARQLFVTAAKDRTLRLWGGPGWNSLLQNTSGRPVQAVELARLRGHTDHVETVCAAPMSMVPHTAAGWDGQTTARWTVASGGWDQTIRVWSWTKDDLPMSQWDAEMENTNKKRRTTHPQQDSQSSSTSSSFSAKIVLRGHQEVVTSLCWPVPSSLYSGSHDRSIRLWDLKRASNVTSFHAQSAVNCLGFSMRRNLLATGHSDGAVRLWDPRVYGTDSGRDRSVVRRQLSGHDGWVTFVQFHPEARFAGKKNSSTAHLLCSGGYDGTVMLWDLRADRPLHVVHPDEGSEPSEPSRYMDGGWAVPFRSKEGAGDGFATVLAGGTSCVVDSYHVQL